ncbi:MAG: dihydrofolate reductase [Coriobacteriales bacterium]|nr:dihydrofolate reductase [Coriobacteriales bacterium]
MDAIVSVTRDWGIGHNGSLVVDNRADMRRFVALTCGGKRPKDAAPGEVLGTVIMGRKTFESFPGGALKARRNLVITRNESFTAPGAEVVHSVSEALASVADSDPDTVWLIGGESIYRQLLPYCHRVHVTYNDVTVPVDASFPDLDADSSWQLAEEAPGGTTDAGVSFTYRTYLHK